MQFRYKICNALYDSEIFRDFLFLQEVTIEITSLINAVKLFLKFLHLNQKCEAVRHFTIAEWTKRVLLGFVYHIHIKLITYSDFYVCC